MERSLLVERLSARLERVSAVDVDRLAGYLAELGRWAARMSLAGPAFLKDPVTPVVESLAVLDLELPPPDLLVDLGSGNGIPAIPLAIAWRPRRTILVEPRERRWAFLTSVSRELGLAVEPRRERWEELLESELGEPVSAISTRGLGGEEAWIDGFVPKMSPGATILLFSGNERCRRVEARAVGFRRRARQPFGDSGRELLVLERVFPVEQSRDTMARPEE